MTKTPDGPNVNNRFSQQRDPANEYHQLRPRSLRSEGKELDEACGGEIQQAEAGLGLDAAIRKLDK